MKTLAQKKKKTEKPKSDRILEAFQQDLEMFRLELSLSHHSPSTDELAQLAAVLALKKDTITFLSEKEQEQMGLDNLEFGPRRTTTAPALRLAREALVLWNSCEHVLKNEKHREGKNVLADDRDVAYREMMVQEIGEDAYYRVNEPKSFPVLFDHALELIVGKAPRVADRHKNFRDFLRNFYKERGKEEIAIESLAAEKFAALKADGFGEEPFRLVKTLFENWKAEQRKKKATHAGKKRWEEAKNKKAK